ncbi:MAG: nucleotidyltransferase domain-containing protein [Candidatus Eremiobacterota bacterium]
MKNNLIEAVKHTVLNIDQSAQIILYGSRSRGEEEEYSDWDFLILLDKKPDYEKIRAIRHNLYKIELETGEIISSIIREKEEWNSSLYRSTPFYKNVMKEAIIL